MAQDCPIKYTTISKQGAVCIWNKNLFLQKQFMIPKAYDSKSRRPVREWITDACFLPNCRKVVLASTGRDLRFFDATSGIYIEETRIFALPHIPSCLHYWYNKNNISDPSLLFFGDDSGTISILKFAQPLSQLFSESFKASSTHMINAQKLKSQEPHVSFWQYDHVHSSSGVKKLTYLPHSRSMVSASQSPNSSLVVSHLDAKVKSYVFKTGKGVECFDYSRSLNVLVSGSLDHVMRVWNVYVTCKPVAVLEGHSRGLVDLIIHDNAIYSYDRAAIIKVWSLRDYKCIQTILLKFPTNLAGRIPEFGAFAMHLQMNAGPTLLVTANDYVASLEVGQLVSAVKQADTTHKSQLCAALYNKYFNQVVTGADDATISVWDLTSGQKSLSFCSAGQPDQPAEEITSMAFDHSLRKLIVGNRDGNIDVWNFQRCQIMQSLERHSESEITGIVSLCDNKVITVGWNRLIVTYDCSNIEQYGIELRDMWNGGQLHKDDILSIAYCKGDGDKHYTADHKCDLLATATHDGQILVWNAGTELLVVKLRSSLQTKYVHLPLSRLTVRPATCDSSHSASRGCKPNRVTLATPPSRPPSRRVNISRPNSRHRNSHVCIEGNPIPVDKLLLLNRRYLHPHQKENDNSAILISSEAGILIFWNINTSENARNKVCYFYAASKSDECILAMACTQSNDVLVIGDTNGAVSLFNICDYALEIGVEQPSPLTIATWQAHNTTVVSVEVVRDTYVLTASTDHTASLYTLEGACVGIFGQNSPWSLDDPSTWRDPISKVTGLRGHINASSRNSTPRSRNSLPEIADGDEEDEVDEEDGGNKSQRSNSQNSDDVFTTMKPLKREHTMLPRLSYAKNSISSDISPLAIDRSQTFAYGSRIQRNLIGKEMENRLSGWINERKLKRITKPEKRRLPSKEFSPFKQLSMKELSEVEMPKKIIPDYR